MFTFSLQSGSSGNSIYVEAGGVRLLFDAGISGKQARGRMAVHNRDIREVDALILSHDHADHSRCAGVYQRLFGFPIYTTEPTFRACNRQFGKVRDVRHFVAGERIQFKSVTVHTFPTPHDATDGVVFVVEHDGKRLGIMTDLGHPFEELRELLASVDAAYLESNFDPVMLEEGPYPGYLKERIRGAGGHISNEEAAELLAACRRDHAWIALSHLSEHNNHPNVAMKTHRAVLGEQRQLFVASRYEVSPVMQV